MTICGLIQAHHLGWDGAKDFSLVSLDGKFVIEHVIDKLRSIPAIDRIVIAVPDCKRNGIFWKIARNAGVNCHFGPTENVLERCRQAIDSVNGAIVVHVMGQHWCVDADLLKRMLGFRELNEINYLSMPDDFTPNFAGKIYDHKILALAKSRIDREPETDRPLHRARFCSYIENNRGWFNAQIFNEILEYLPDYLHFIREQAAQVYKCDRLHLNEAKASHISNPLTESYQFARDELSPTDHVLDIACGNGHGARVLAPKVKYVTAVDINGPLIATNRKKNRCPNISYERRNALNLSLEPASVTAATAMEIIEHLTPDDANRFLAEVRRVISPGGKFICSTPQNSNGAIPIVPFHVKEYSRPELHALLSKHFPTVKILSSKSGGKLSTANQTGQKMLAICQ